MKKFIIFILILLTLLPSTAETLFFGRYYQTYSINGAKSPVEWLILTETDDAYFLLSKYALDANRFGSSRYPCYWANSEVRSFLNSEFLQEAFTEKEQQYILLTNTSLGHPSKDYIFLLSIEEVKQYLTDRSAYATQFARIGHLRIIGEKWGGAATTNTGAVHWWLRNSGVDYYHAIFIAPNGTISIRGDRVSSPHFALRPALWVNKTFFKGDK